jgi:hypothetical protein
MCAARLDRYNLATADPASFGAILSVFSHRFRVDGGAATARPDAPAGSRRKDQRRQRNGNIGL